MLTYLGCHGNLLNDMLYGCHGYVYVVSGEYWQLSEWIWSCGFCWNGENDVLFCLENISSKKSLNLNLIFIIRDS